MEETVSNPILAINTMASSLFNSIDTSIYGVLDDITFIKPSILNDTFITSILGTNFHSGLLLICNSLLIGFVLYYLVSLILSHLVSFKLQTPAQFVFKLIIITIILNSSYDICSFLLELNSDISESIMELGENLFKTPISFISMQEKVAMIDNKSIFNLFSIQGLFKSFSTIGIVNLVLSYSLRYIMIKVFVLLFPFAVISLLNESTAYFFKTYIKSFISILFSQSIICIILLVIFAIDFSSANILFSQVVFIGGLYLLSRVNYFVKELLGGVTNLTFSNAKNLDTFLKKGF